MIWMPWRSAGGLNLHQITAPRGGQYLPFRPSGPGKCLFGNRPTHPLDPPNALRAGSWTLGGLMPSVPGDPKMVSFLKDSSFQEPILWKLLNFRDNFHFCSPRVPTCDTQTTEEQCSGWSVHKTTLCCLKRHNYNIHQIINNGYF